MAIHMVFGIKLLLLHSHVIKNSKTKMNILIIVTSFCLLPTTFSNLLKKKGSKEYNIDSLDNTESHNFGEPTSFINDGKFYLDTVPVKRNVFREIANQARLPSFSFSSRNSSSSEKSSNLSTSPRGSSTSSRGSSKTTRSPSKSNSASSEAYERHASSDSPRPDYLNSVVLLNDENPILWDQLDSNLSMPENLEALLKQYFVIENYGRNEPFKTKVRATLGFIQRHGFHLNPFILNLTIKLVKMYDEKAPNALKLFLESRFSFMKTFEWNETTFISRMEALLKGSSGYNAKLFQDSAFRGHLQTLFLDLLKNEPNSFYNVEERINLMFMMYMELFSSSTSEVDFYRRYTFVVRIILKMSHEAFHGVEVTNDRVETVFNNRFESFRAKMDEFL